MKVHGQQKPKMRLDRLYIRYCQTGVQIKPIYFELVGTEKLEACDDFPSDHYGILCHFNMVAD